MVARDVTTYRHVLWLLIPVDHAVLKFNSHFLTVQPQHGLCKDRKHMQKYERTAELTWQLVGALPTALPDLTSYVTALHARGSMRCCHSSQIPRRKLVNAAVRSFDEELITVMLLAAAIDLVWGSQRQAVTSLTWVFQQVVGIDDDGRLPELLGDELVDLVKLGEAHLRRVE